MAGGEEADAEGLLGNLRRAPPWKIALLGGAALAAAGTALFSLLLAMAAAFILFLLFSALIGRPGAAEEVPVQVSPPVTYH